MADKEALDVGLRFVLSDEPVDNWTHLTDLLHLDIPALTGPVVNAQDYTRTLSKPIFDRDDIASFYSVSRVRAGDRPVHFRVNIDGPSSLHRVRWELLQDPTTKYPIATTDHVLFSRYMSNPDFRAVPWRARPAARALVVIAAPTDLGPRLAKVDIDRERQYAESALQGIQTVFLAGPGQPTLANLTRELEREIDILYLVCHGGFTSDVPFILLENKDGTAHQVDARRLQETVVALAYRPTLALLNSCQSWTADGAETTDDGALAGLGPRLAGAGISTVIAMQDNVTMETAQLFVKRFFAELRHDGVVDRAVAAARRSLREESRWDWWVPVLFSRLRSGRTYFKAEFTEEGDETWATLRAVRRTGRFTPVLGPGMSDEVLGSKQDIAERWADRWQMPIAAHSRQDLAKVAQYLRVEQKVPGELPTRMAEYLQEEVLERINAAAADPADPFHAVDPTISTQAAIMEVGRRLLERDPGYAYKTVAAMPVPVFVTTNWTLLLEQALQACVPKKVPKTFYFPWNDRAEWPEQSGPVTPTPEEPLVYHLFGRLEDPDSLVISEDDYFEWLTAWIAKQSLVPEVVAKLLTNRSLLFLGYRLDDWEFRVLFQSIKSFPSSSLQLPRNKHVGVQLSPGLREIEPEAAQDYLESYFGNDRVSIYWSDTRRFLDEYRARTGPAT
jgi:hypothetical protein